METEIRIVIADDHPIFRKGLRQVIETDARLKVIGEADDGLTALEQIRGMQPDVVVLDVDMPNKDGFEVARAVQDERLAVEIIFLTMHKDERFFNAALDLGVKGYVLKDSVVTEIIGGIRAVAAGQNYISPPLSNYIVNRSRRAAALAQQKPGLSDLTPTERRVLNLIAEYKTSREIAGELFISTRTVEHHRANISMKLELQGSHALLKFALEHKSELS
ncbi:MAG: response regulator transcription factor [Acidobacteria bacterium]|nr:response regulator transcription factor [Acidobacteriota bacterium]